MRPYFIKIFICFVFFSNLQLSSAKDGKKEDKNYTIIVSLDGFRWDYPQLYNTPNLDKISHRGVSAVMKPSYPSSTFPNHYTLITGLVPDHHGIINNTFWDRKNERQYSMGDSITRNNSNYYKGEPIWITAEKQSVTTGSLYWIGSDIAIKGMHPTYYKVWADEPRLTFAQRIDTALVWLNKTESERPHLITLYMEEPDGTGHRFGPNGEETRNTVQMVDSLIGVLIKGIDSLSFSKQVNLIVTSDHGMTNISPERFINVNDYLKPEWYQRIAGSNPSSIFCDTNYCDSIYNILSEVDHIRVFKKDEISPSLNYGTNENIGDLIVIADCGWQFGFSSLPTHGAHGYDTACTDMHVIFFAYGPDFKENYKGTMFDNTAIYSLLANLLGIEPAKTDGDINQITQFLRE
ncbi:alkaline phosphatase family protein [Dysgonomonas macrotermitis]|uniref:Predicted pyrophosphatase or phosphodiesterase, AlkP superfamily n=1 Tax=Dysgonomonas macrotermitis TaxID=1346286 RepID=A0A1M4W9E1_9BACT|nr:alkaline phosphatase family protein [Dysgonomonas macrotermitis]SHE77785.1 Predicted pyrophosphatase or phosphodiesterase, AlkP superfamily [Dysgonomonas macrotermitis]